MLTVRLPESLERELEILSIQKQTTKTDIVKEALIEYMRIHSKTSYEAGKDLFGCDDSPINDGSLNYKQNIRRRIHEKHSH
ncbi:MAG TPA: CopG family transcriptional regulator [Clostridiaceae bacterium]|jgi:hypothetical protein|nr:CopG family transcriptional regulator [Clostridiaceae bacterium]